MKNLVTGATGLVGMHVILDLLIKKESVKATFTKNSRLENVKKLFDFYGKSSLFNEIEWVEMNVDDIVPDVIVEAVMMFNESAASPLELA